MEEENNISKFTFTPEQIFRIYKQSYTISESRGKNRQNTINDVVVETLKNHSDYIDCTFKTEVRIPESKILWGKYFPVDVCVYKGDELIEIILIKAPASNLLQNKVNTLNSINSDITRLSGLDGINIKLFNFLPSKSPYFKQNENIKEIESNTPFFLTKSGANYKFNVDEIYIIFEIDGVEKCLSKKEVKSLFNENPIKNIIIKESNYKGTH